MPNLTPTTGPLPFLPDGHLEPNLAAELRHLLVTGERHLSVTFQMVDTRGAATTTSVHLPHDPARAANALNDLADVLHPLERAPGREEPLEAPELADTLADAYEAAVKAPADRWGDEGLMRADFAQADDLLAALGAVLASAYLESRRGE